ncbi:MAG: hypothetical protein ACK56I_19285, partial [bacterium]
ACSAASSSWVSFFSSAYPRPKGNRCRNDRLTPYRRLRASLASEVGEPRDLDLHAAGRFFAPAAPR